MEKFQLVLLLVFIFLSKSLCERSCGPYGCMCKCAGFSCGASGTHNGNECWYNCCWMTMSYNYKKIFWEIKNSFNFFFKMELKWVAFQIVKQNEL